MPHRGYLDTLTVDLEPGDAFPQNVVHLGDPVLDHRVDALEARFNLRQFPLQANDPAIDLGGFGGAAGGDGGEDFDEAEVKRRSDRCSTTRSSSVSMRIERPVQTLLPARAVLEHV